jgi:hypothetical protein
MKKVLEYELESCGSGQWLVACCCEHGNGPQCSIKCDHFLISQATATFSGILLHGVSKHCSSFNYIGSCSGFPIRTQRNLTTLKLPKKMHLSDKVINESLTSTYNFYIFKI